MKMKIILTAIVSTVLSSAALTGCSTKPVDELKMAASARDLARKAEAPEYAPYEWDRARTQWDEANSLIQIGRYGEARNILIEVVAHYNDARDRATHRVESLQLEIKAMQSSAETDLKRLEEEANNPKLPARVRNRIDSAIPLIEEKVATMNSDFEDKEYLRSQMAGHEAVRYILELRKRLAIN